MISFIFLLLFIFLLTACSLINPPEELPAYIQFDSAVVIVDSSSGFQSSLGVKDIWLFQDGKLTGIQPLPSTVPYIHLDQTDFFLEGGVYESGLSSFKLPYPFWKQVEFQTGGIPGDTLVVHPVFRYFSDDEIDFSFEEDFEGGIKFETAGLESVPATLSPGMTTVFHGSRSGEVLIDSAGKFLNVKSLTPLPNISNDNDIWAEITYKTDVSFQAGVWRQVQGGPFAGFSEVVITPKEDWNTVYIHLASLVRAAQGTPVYFWIRAGSANSTGTIHLDNIRVVNFDL